MGRNRKNPDGLVDIVEDTDASPIAGQQGETHTPPNGEPSPRPFGGRQGPLSEADKAQRLANRRQLFLMRRTAEDADDELIGVFDNKFALRKFMQHAVILDKKLAARVYVVKGRQLDMGAVFNG